jgi:hypothetical protein
MKLPELVQFISVNLNHGSKHFKVSALSLLVCAFLMCMFDLHRCRVMLTIKYEVYGRLLRCWQRFLCFINRSEVQR